MVFAVRDCLLSDFLVCRKEQSVSENLWLGATVILMGGVVLFRAYSREKAGAVMTLKRPEDGLMNQRERRFAFFIGVGQVILGLLNIWVGFRHR
jgi:hypothetical protein